MGIIEDLRLERKGWEEGEQRRASQQFYPLSAIVLVAALSFDEEETRLGSVGRTS
jgi:hypothetical protein